MYEAGIISQGLSFLDFIKLIVGPFIGAFLAFLSNDILHRRRKEEEEIAIVHNAWFAIGAMFDDFHNYRYFVRTLAAQMNEQCHQQSIGPVPVWAFARPLLFEFRESGLPELTSLKFLLSSRDGQLAFQHLQFLERSYRSLALTHRKHNETGEELQVKLQSYEQSTWAEAEVAIGKQLVAKARHLVIHQFLAVLEDERFYTNARDALKKAAEEKYGEKIDLVVFETREGFNAQELPPVPPTIIKQIKEAEMS